VPFSTENSITYHNAKIEFPAASAAILKQTSIIQRTFKKDYLLKQIKSSNEKTWASSFFIPKQSYPFWNATILSRLMIKSSGKSCSKEESHFTYILQRLTYLPLAQVDGFVINAKCNYLANVTFYCKPKILSAGLSSLRIETLGFSK